MRRGRLSAVLGAIVAVTLVTAAAALGADSRTIYQDLADGHLSGSYTQAELRAAAKDATVEGYGGVAEQTMRPVVEQAAGAERTEVCVGLDESGNKIMRPASSTDATDSAACVAGTQFTRTRTAETLPFTGVQLGVFAALGVALLGGGLLLRRAARD